MTSFEGGGGVFQKWWQKVTKEGRGLLSIVMSPVLFFIMIIYFISSNLLVINSTVSCITFFMFYNRTLIFHNTSQYVCRIPIGNPIQKSYILRSSQISDIASKRNFWTYKLI